MIEQRRTKACDITVESDRPVKAYRCPVFFSSFVEIDSFEFDDNGAVEFGSSDESSRSEATEYERAEPSAVVSFSCDMLPLPTLNTEAAALLAGGVT